MFKLDYKLQEIAFFAVLILNAAVLPFSEALISISAGLMIFQTLFFRSWKHPSVKMDNQRVLLFPVSIFFVYLIGTLFTQNFQLALIELNKSLFWLVVPLAVYYSPRITAPKFYIVLGVFISAVIISSLIITAKLIFLDSIYLTDFRKMSLISHIRFSFQVGFAIILLTWGIFQKSHVRYNIKPVWLFLAILWLVVFLFLLKSLIGILAFLGTGIIALLYVVFYEKNRIKKSILIAFVVMIIFLPLFYIHKVADDYYSFKAIDPDTVDQTTMSGNHYVHDFNSHLRENGYLVYIYICEPELRQEWNKRSEIKYDDDLNGYPLSSTLIRYLTSLGYRKDSVGISKLSTEDIQYIEQGTTNFRFSNHFFSIYPRVYETIWEFDNYLHTKDPSDKSFAQRIEFTKAAIVIIKDKPLFGIGTGNWMTAYGDAYSTLNTKLDKEDWRPVHNQYLNYIVKFGVFGFLWIMYALLAPLYFKGHNR